MQLKPHEFWALTYAEFSDMVDGFNRNKKRRRDELLFTAWHTALYTRLKELPEFNTILNVEEKTPEVTTKEPNHNAMMAMAKALNEKWGGKFIRT
jgi:hypothetical protein